MFFYYLWIFLRVYCAVGFIAYIVLRIIEKYVKRSEKGLAIPLLVWSLAWPVMCLYFDTIFSEEEV